MAFDWRYVPLNVKTYREAYNRLAGPICVSLLAIITGFLLLSYELLLLNVEDADFRDMLFDHRITSFGTRYHHKQFFNAAFCCHEDAAVFRYRCNATLADYWIPDPPYCPPSVEFTCTSLRSANCTKVRTAVYRALGLDPLTGQPSNCTRAGRVRVRAAVGLPPAADTSLLRVRWKGALQNSSSFRIPPAGIDSVPQADLDDWVDAVAANYSDLGYIMPRAPLARLLSIDGFTVSLGYNVTKGRPWNDALGWPWELWPWPPQSSCPNTHRPPQLFVAGNVQVAFPRWSATTPPTITIALAGGSGSSLRVPAYAINVTDPEDPDQVQLLRLTALEIKVALVPVAGGCGAWQLDAGATSASYGALLWKGTKSKLEGLSGALGGGMQLVAVQVRDVAAPRHLALPAYAGQAYIFGTLMAGAVWALSGGSVIGLSLLIYINVQRNRGRPNVFWRYMQRFRGW